MLEKTREQERHSRTTADRACYDACMNGNVIVGITGHQKRRGLDWNWVNDTLRAELVALGSVIVPCRHWRRARTRGSRRSRWN
jgi:iron only hydrogenase large subunit-like protein